MAHTIYARDFGIYPDRYKNSLADINRLIDSIDGGDDDIIVEFDAGKYILSCEETIRRSIHITNTTSEKESRDKAQNIGLLVENKHNITFNGNGSLFVVNGEMIMLMCESSRNIRFENMAFDYTRPTVTEMHIDKATMTTIECTINKATKYKIEDGKIVFYGDNFEIKKPHHTIIYDSVEDRTYNSSYSPIKTALSVTELEPYKVKFSSTPRTTSEKIYDGLTFLVRNNIKSAVGVFIDKSNGVTFDSVMFHYMHGLGIVGQMSKDLTFNKVSCAPRKETGRHNSAFSDMMHFSMCNGKITVRDSVFSGSGANGINIHGSYLIVKQKISDRRILLEFAHQATYGFDAFKAGDNIEAIDVLTHNLQWANKVKSVKVVDKTHLLLDLVTPFDNIKVGQAVENVTKTPAVEITRCTFNNIPANAIMVTTRQPISITRNTFDRVAMSAIVMSEDTKTWYESGKVMDARIEKNTFNRCGFKAGNAVISIEPKNVIPNSKWAVNKNIKVIDNKFILDKTSAFEAKSTQGILLSNNRYEGDTSKYIYKLNCCADVVLDGEDYTTGDSKMSTLFMDKKDIKA